MAYKPAEVRYSQVACEFENYCLQRGQSLTYNVDLNSEEVNQLTDENIVEIVDADPSVTINLETNEFGSVVLLGVLAGYYAGHTDNTFSTDLIEENPIDVLVSIKDSLGDTSAYRSAWFNYCFVDSITGSYVVDGFAKESVSLSGKSMRWFQNTTGSGTGATKIFRYTKNASGYLEVDSLFDEPGVVGGLHVLTEDGQIVPDSSYTYDTLTHAITPVGDFTFSDTKRYRGIFWGRQDFPQPVDVGNPIGGIVASELEVVLWDASAETIDWHNDVGTTTSRRLLRAQSIDYEISFDREVLKETLSSMFSSSVNSVSITATITLLDSDLEELAIGAGKYTDYTSGDLTTFTLDDFQNVSDLRLCINIFNTRLPSNHNIDSLLKQIYFTGGTITGIGKSADVPGRGTRTIDVKFSDCTVRGTGAAGRSSASLWGGKDYAFVFVSDDGVSHNVGWGSVVRDEGVKYTAAVCTSATKTTNVYYLEQSEIDALNDVVDWAYHSYSHANAGMTVPDSTPGITGTLTGYFNAANDAGITYFSNWDEAEPYYLHEISRHAFVYRAGQGSRMPTGLSFDDARYFVYPGGAYDTTIMWDLFRSGYYGARTTVALSNYSGAIKNDRDAISLMRIPNAAHIQDLVGATPAVWTEAEVKSAFRTYISDVFGPGGTYEGGIAVVFAHSFGSDAYDAVNYPNGYPASEGEAIPWYVEGLRMNELRWLIEEAKATNAKVLTFNQAVGQFWELSRYVNNPEERFGTEFANDIIFEIGTGSKYPEGEDYSDLSVRDSDFIYFVYRGSTLSSVLDASGIINGDADWQRVDYPLCVTIVPVAPTISDPDAVQYYVKDSGVTAEPRAVEEQLFSYPYIEDYNQITIQEPVDITTVYSYADVTNGWVSKLYGAGVDTRVYHQSYVKVASAFYDRHVKRESCFISHVIELCGPAGVLYQFEE